MADPQSFLGNLVRRQDEAWRSKRFRQHQPVNFHAPVLIT